MMCVKDWTEEFGRRRYQLQEEYNRRFAEVSTAEELQELEEWRYAEERQMEYDMAQKVKKVSA